MSASRILSRLRHKGQITEEEYRKLKNSEKHMQKVIEDIRAEIEFERDRKLGGEAFEAVQYKAYQTALDIIDKHIKGVNE